MSVIYSNNKVFLTTTTNQFSSPMLVLNILTFLFASILIIFVAYYTTRFFALKFGHHSSDKNMKIIERFSLGLDRSLVLIQLNSIYYLISVTKNNIELLDRIDNLDIKISAEKPNSFEDILLKLRTKK